MSKLIFNKNYFSSKKGKLIFPEELDNHFNCIELYINNTLIPRIEEITFIKTNGVAGSTSSVFCNIDNNQVGYMYIQDINIDDNLISLGKLQKIPSGSILGSNSDGDIFTITPTDNNQLLFIDFLDNINFRKIISEDIDNNLLTGTQLNVLANENFVIGAFNDIILDNSISEQNLQNVSNKKIAPLSIDFKHIGIFEDLPYNVYLAQQLKLEDFNDNSITPQKIKDSSISSQNFNETQFIVGNNLVLGSITDNHFQPYNTTRQPPTIVNLANLTTSSFGAIINFPDNGINVHNIKLPRQKIALNSISIDFFNSEIINAINTYQDIKNKQSAPPLQMKKTKPDNAKYLGYFNLNPPIDVPNTTQGLKYVTIAVVPSGRINTGNTKGTWHWYVGGFMTNEWIYMRRGDFIIIPLRIINASLGQYEHSNIYIGSVPGLELALSNYPRESGLIPEFYRW